MNIPVLKQVFNVKQLVGVYEWKEEEEEEKKEKKSKKCFFFM